MAGASKRLSSSSSSSSSKSTVKTKPESKSVPKKTGVTPSTKSTIKNVKTVSNSNSKKTNSKTTTIKSKTTNQRGGWPWDKPKPNNSQYPFDPEKVNEIIEELGYPFPRPGPQSFGGIQNKTLLNEYLNTYIYFDDDGNTRRIVSDAMMENRLKNGLAKWNKQQTTATSSPQPSW